MYVTTSACSEPPPPPPPPPSDTTPPSVPTSQTISQVSSPASDVVGRVDRQRWRGRVQRLPRRRRRSGRRPRRRTRIPGLPVAAPTRWRSRRVTRRGTCRTGRTPTGPATTSACSSPPPPPPPGDTTAPTAPTALSQSQRTEVSFTVSWTASSDNVAVGGLQRLQQRRQGRLDRGDLVRSFRFHLRCERHRRCRGVRPGRERLAAHDSGDVDRSVCASAAFGYDAAVGADESDDLAGEPDRLPDVVGRVDRQRRCGRVQRVPRRRQGRVADGDVVHLFRFACGRTYMVALEARDAAGNVSDKAYATGSVTTIGLRARSHRRRPRATRRRPTTPSSVRVVASGVDERNGVVDGFDRQRRRRGLRRSTAEAPASPRPARPATPSRVSSAARVTRSESTRTTRPPTARHRPRSSRRRVPARIPQAPSVPTGLAQTASNETSVVIRWTASTDNVGVAGYGVYQGGVRVDSTAADHLHRRRIQLRQDLHGRRRRIRRGRQPVVAGDPCRRDCGVFCRHGAAVGAAESSRCRARRRTGFTLTWSPSTDNVGVTGYNVYLNGTRVTTVTTSSYAFAGLTCGTTYHRSGRGARRGRQRLLQSHCVGHDGRVQCATLRLVAARVDVGL